MIQIKTQKHTILNILLFDKKIKFNHIFCIVLGIFWNNTIVVFFSDNGGVSSNENYPLRGAKRRLYEGGIRTVSFITGGYINNNLYGKIYNKYFHITDWFPTLLSLAGINYNIDIFDHTSYVSTQIV